MWLLTQCFKPQPVLRLQIRPILHN